MTYNEIIENIMFDVENGSDEPFIIYRDDQGSWQRDYIQNQHRDKFALVDDIKSQDPLASVLTGRNFSNGSYATVYDAVLCHRIREEYDLVRKFDSDAANLGAIASFFEEHVNYLSQEVMTYLINLERPLAALQEMIPYDMTTGRTGRSYNESLADDAIAYIESHVHIENSVHRYMNPHIHKSVVGRHDHDVDGNTSSIDESNTEGYQGKHSIQNTGIAKKPSLQEKLNTAKKKRNHTKNTGQPNKELKLGKSR